MITSQLPAEELAELKTECLDIVSSIEESLMKLGSEPNLVIVDDLFRSFHNIKGMAGFMGLAQMQTIAGKSESILDIHRKNKLGINVEVSSLFQNGLDLIKKIVAHRSHVEDSSIDKYRQNINDYIARFEDAKLSDVSVIVDKNDVSSNFVSYDLDGKTDGLQVMEKVFHDISAEISNFAGDVADKKELQKLQYSFGVMQKLATKLENPKILKTATLLHNFFKTYAKDSITAPNKLISQAKTVIDHLFGLVFLKKNSLSDKLLKNQEENLQKFEEELNHTIEQKKNEIFEEVGNTASFSFRIEADSMMQIMQALEDVDKSRHKFKSSYQKFLSDSLFKQESIDDLEIFNQYFVVLHNLMYKATKIPLKHLFYRFIRVVKNAADLVNKKINFNMAGENLEIDKAYLNPLNISIIHLLRNSCDHGIENPEERISAGKNPVGVIDMEATVKEYNLILTISDDGRGLDRSEITKKLLNLKWYTPEEAKAMSEQEIFAQIFKPGFSTVDKVTEISGRGVGMDVVNREIDKLNGKINISSKPGLGLKIKIILPFLPR